MLALIVVVTDGYGRLLMVSSPQVVACTLSASFVQVWALNSDELTPWARNEGKGGGERGSGLGAAEGGDAHTQRGEAAAVEQRERELAKAEAARAQKQVRALTKPELNPYPTP